jgi:hypothetical protein
MRKRDTVKLALMTIIKGLFFIITYPIVWLLLFIDVLVHILSMGMYESYLSENMTRFTISIMNKMLQIEFKILFKK